MRGEEPIAFDSDCREGICGTCSLTINGEAHGPDHPGAACELYMRKFRDGDNDHGRTVSRRSSFPLIKDLVVDRSALDRIVQAGGFISARAGSAPEANSILVPKHDADLAMEAAACIGCGACAAACPNAIGHAFHRGEGFASGVSAAGRSRNATSRVLKMVRSDGCGRLRQLHQHLRMRSGLSGGDQRQFHRETESRIRASAIPAKRGRITSRVSPVSRKRTRPRVRSAACASPVAVSHGLALADVPERYGPPTTCYNRFVRWRKAGVWDRILADISKAFDGDIIMIDFPASACTNMVQRQKGGLTMAAWDVPVAGLRPRSMPLSMRKAARSLSN